MARAPCLLAAAVAVAYSLPTAAAQNTLAPTTPTPTSGPTANLVILGDNYCPTGYLDYGTRYNAGLGRINIVTAHEECAARCTTYSGTQYDGGCRSYMTGMYFGSLYCRSYGKNARTKPCPYWSKPGNKGIGSGAFGSVHGETNQENIGGQCCSNMTWVDLTQVGSSGADQTAAFASSSSSDTSASSDDATVGIAITLGALVLLYGIFKVGQHVGQRGSAGLTPAHRHQSTGHELTQIQGTALP